MEEKSLQYLKATLKDTAERESQMAVMRSRMEKYESALKAIGEKLNLDVNAFLH